MLPQVAKDGRPFIPSRVYTIIGLGAIILGGARSASVRAPAVGAVLLVMGLAIEVSVLQARIVKLERESEALRHPPSKDSDREV